MPNWCKTLLLSLTAIAFSLIFVEIGFRIYAAFQVGPSALWYGIAQKHEHEVLNHTVMDHKNDFGSYTKYFPNEIKVDHDKETNEIFRVTINRRGFRGQDYEDQKSPGIIRVITLGSSSTFGYHDRDNETYPFYLQQILNQQCGDTGSFEVINLGIPHLTSSQILALFVNEALPLEPDVVTFYEGVNDSAAMTTENIKQRYATPLKETSFYDYARNAFALLREHLLLFSYIHQVRQTMFAQLSEEFVKTQLQGKSERFLGNLSQIHEIAKKRDVIFIVANQQAQSHLFDRQTIKGTTYQKEAALVSQKMKETGYLNEKEMFFYTHSILMQDLRTWASDRNVPFVDVIGALNKDRDVLLTWVHLSPKGNRMIANVLAKEILSRVCPMSTTRSQ